MAQRTDARQTQRQEQRLSPKMYQVMELMELPLGALAERIRQEQLENPFLELDATAEDDDGPPETTDASEEGLDWETWARESAPPVGPAAGAGTPAAGPPAAGPDQTPDHEGREAALTHQLDLVRMPEAERRLARTIVGELEADGYLRTPLARIVRHVRSTRDGHAGAPGATGVTLAAAHRALRTVQQLEPTGIAARTLQECLALQLADREGTGTLAYRLVTDAFDALTDRDFAAAADRLGVSVDRVRQAAAHVAHLDPAPGREEEERAAEYVTPDVIVLERDGDYHVAHNDDRVPRVRLAHAYRQLVEDGRDLSDEERAFVRDKWSSARWIVDAIEQRRRTVIRVMEAIVDHQRPFLEEGIEHMRPLTMAEVADDVGVHESTVSRVASGKYVQTPRGLYPVKFFFSPGLPSEFGEDVSTHAVRAKIETLIAEEPADDPLSDQQIADALERIDGIHLARRTVAKYRSQLGYPSSRDRRRR